MPKGRPPKDDETLAEQKAAFLHIITEGGTWRKAQDELKISSSTISLWLREDEEFKKRYARACDVRADAIFEEMLSIADDGRNDWMEIISKDGEVLGYKENGEALRRSALRIEARKWMLGKMKPKVYGDKVELEHTGSGGGPIQVAWTVVDPQSNQ